MTIKTLGTKSFAGWSRMNRNGIDEGTFLRSRIPSCWAHKVHTEIRLLEEAFVSDGQRGSFGRSFSIPARWHE
jgi:hypothetical protein